MNVDVGEFREVVGPTTPLPSDNNIRTKPVPAILYDCPYGQYCGTDEHLRPAPPWGKFQVDRCH